MNQRTCLYDRHVALGARMVDFGGWDMPLNYGSQIEEHHIVRRDAGMFDVSHMTVVDLAGKSCGEFLRYLLANDPGKLPGRGHALYSCMLREDGGIIDDLITYYMGPDRSRMVVNAATRDKDLAWIEKQAEAFGVSVGERPDQAMIAVQGPQARERAASVLEDALASQALALKRFAAVENGDWWVARTGYTGEDGFEVMLPGDDAPRFWERLMGAGVYACGLGARDTLRLEAGMNLYGTDMDETTTPLESGLGWTVAWEPEDRDFIGRQALEAQREAGVPRKLVGLVLDERGVLRGGQTVLAGGVAVGQITSGSFSPTLGKSVALARVSAKVSGACQVEVRGRAMDVRMVRPPFVRNGKACEGI